MMFAARRAGRLQRLFAAFTVAVLAMIAVVRPAMAEAKSDHWPTRAVTLIVPSTSGGGADILTRIVATHLTRATGVPFIVENRPGMGGSIGMSLVKRAAPDGYTLGYGNMNTLAVNASLFNQLGYDANQDFTVVAALFLVPSFVVVPADSPYQSIGDLIAAAKQSPGKMFWAGGNVGSSGHMGGELFKTMAGINTLYVPYSGDPASLDDLMAGKLDYALPNAPIAWPLIKSGKLRALAVTSPTRMALFPQIPTMEESGLKGYCTYAWGTIIAPVGTPPAIVDRMTAVVEKVVKSDALRADLAKLLTSPLQMNRAEMTRFVGTERDKWAAVIRSANIEKQ